MPAFKDLSALKDLGDYIRDQRRTSQISLRQLAAIAGVSNPYLSQIERGLRKPSADILAQIAKGLSVSAEAMYVQAGILDERAGDPHVAAAIMGDPGLTDRQKHVLMEIYDSFAAENDERRADSPTAAPWPAPEPAAKETVAAEVPVDATQPPPPPAGKVTKKPRRKSAAAKSGAARTAAKKAGATKKAAETTAARKTAARKTAAEKLAAKKAAPKNTAAKKTAAKKAAAKKTAAKKSASPRTGS